MAERSLRPRDASARHHAERKLFHNRELPDPELGAFRAGTPAFDAYRRDLFWAQDYAALNRAVLLELGAAVLRRAWPKAQFGTLVSWVGHKRVVDSTALYDAVAEPHAGSTGRFPSTPSSGADPSGRWRWRCFAPRLHRSRGGAAHRMVAVNRPGKSAARCHVPRPLYAPVAAGLKRFMRAAREGTFRAARFAVLALGALALAGCSGSEPTPDEAGGSAGAIPTQSSVASEKPVVGLPPGNPFEAMPLYVYPDTWAAKAAEMLRASSPDEAALADKIAEQPAAEWFSYPYEAIASEVDDYVSAAASAGALPVLVPYHLPNRDCGLYSAGGAEDPQGYRDWAAAFVAAIGDRPAIVVLEPDSLPQLDTCLSEGDQAQRLELIRSFAEALSALPSTAVYLDAGHSSWISADIMAERLVEAGIAEVRGFSLNVSNYQRDADLLRYGHDLIARLGLDTHFVIDSSRNGNGPAAGPDNWCNPTGRALGRAPTADTGDAALDAYLWVKRPGESDGECLGGPAPGLWFPERAFELARNASW